MQVIVSIFFDFSYDVTTGNPTWQIVFNYLVYYAKVCFLHFQYKNANKIFELKHMQQEWHLENNVTL